MKAEIAKAEIMDSPIPNPQSKIPNPPPAFFLLPSLHASPALVSIVRTDPFSSVPFREIRGQIFEFRVYRRSSDRMNRIYRMISLAMASFCLLTSYFFLPWLCAPR